MSQEHLSTSVYDEGTSELFHARALGWQPLQMAFDEAQRSPRKHLGGESVHSRSLGQAHGFVGNPVSIDEKRERDLSLPFEVGRHLREALADRDDLRTSGFDILIPVTQLRDVLAAESSAEVAKPDEYDRLGLPEVRERVIVSLRVRQRH